MKELRVHQEVEVLFEDFLWTRATVKKLHTNHVTLVLERRMRAWGYRVAAKQLMTVRKDAGRIVPLLTFTVDFETHAKIYKKKHKNFGVPGLPVFYAEETTSE